MNLYGENIMKIDILSVKKTEFKKVTFSNGISATYKLIEDKVEDFVFDVSQYPEYVLSVSFLKKEIDSSVCAGQLSDYHSFKRIKNENDIFAIENNIDNMRMFNEQFIFTVDGIIIPINLELTDLYFQFVSKNNLENIEHVLNYLKSQDDFIVLKSDISEVPIYNQDDDVDYKQMKLDVLIGFKDSETMLELLKSNDKRYISIYSFVENIARRYKSDNPTRYLQD